MWAICGEPTDCTKGRGGGSARFRNSARGREDGCRCEANFCTVRESNATPEPETGVHDIVLTLAVSTCDSLHAIGDFMARHQRRGSSGPGVLTRNRKTT